MSDGIRGIAARVRAGQEATKGSKANRMYVAAEPQYTILQTYCKAKGFKVNAVLDDLVRVFLLELSDDPELRAFAAEWSYDFVAGRIVDDGAA